MSMHDIRQAFQAAAMPVDPALAHKGYRVVGARMSYCDKDGKSDGARDHQLLEFDVVRGSDNTTKTVKSDPVPNNQSPVVAAILLAQKHCNPEN